MLARQHAIVDSSSDSRWAYCLRQQRASSHVAATGLDMWFVGIEHVVTCKLELTIRFCVVLADNACLSHLKHAVTAETRHKSFPAELLRSHVKFHHEQKVCT